MAIDADTGHSRNKRKKLEKYIVRGGEILPFFPEILTPALGKEAEAGGASWHSR